MSFLQILQNLVVGVDLKTIFSFLKKYWREILILGLIVGFWVHSANQKSYMAQVYDDLVEAQNAEMKEIEKINKEEIAKRDETIRKFQKQLDDEAVRHQKEIDALNAQKSKRTKELAKQRTDEPEKIINAITNIYGFEYVE
jgi:ABC-type uncharacterized transport system substrate-binding protein